MNDPTPHEEAIEEAAIVEDMGLLFNFDEPESSHARVVRVAATTTRDRMRCLATAMMARAQKTALLPFGPPGASFPYAGDLPTGAQIRAAFEIAKRYNPNDDPALQAVQPQPEE